MKNEFVVANNQISAEKNLDSETVFEAVEAAMASAFKRDDLQYADVVAKIDRATGDIQTWRRYEVMDDDDIEDDDDFRYGNPTLHRTYGLPTAINVGDYMIGLGYHLVSRDIAALGAEVAGDILNLLADAHVRLSEGQGAELPWRDARDTQLAPRGALKTQAACRQGGHSA